MEPNKSLSYLMIGLSVPGKSDELQYFWILQFGSCTGVYLNGMQYFTLFPNQLERFLIWYLIWFLIWYLQIYQTHMQILNLLKGILIGLANGLANIPSIYPQLWLVLIRNDQISFSALMFILAGLGQFFITFCSSTYCERMK